MKRDTCPCPACTTRREREALLRECAAYIKGLCLASEYASELVARIEKELGKR